MTLTVKTLYKWIFHLYHNFKRIFYYTKILLCVNIMNVLLHWHIHSYIFVIPWKDTVHTVQLIRPEWVVQLIRVDWAVTLAIWMGWRDCLCFSLYLAIVLVHHLNYVLAINISGHQKRVHVLNYSLDSLCNEFAQLQFQREAFQGEAFQGDSAIQGAWHSPEFQTDGRLAPLVGTEPTL